MKLLIDDAHIEKIESLYQDFPIDGVTTNPSILAAVGQSPYTVLRRIRSAIGADAELHVQVLASDASGMLDDAHRIVKELGAGTYVKIPAVRAGFRAMRLLSQEGLRVSATTIYTPMQAFLAAQSGALYLIPYVNRIDNLGFDGIQTVQSIHEMLQKNESRAQLLAASFKNVRQIAALYTAGIGACTVAPQLIEQFASNPAFDAALAAFASDFRAPAGDGKTMADC